MSSTRPSPAGWITASSRHWLTMSTCRTAICTSGLHPSLAAPDATSYDTASGLRRSLLLRSSRSHTVPCVWPAEEDRHLSSSEESSLRFDSRWLARLALLADITTHLNALNVKLQGKDILETDMHTYITAFEVKLRLWEAQSANGQLQHYPRLTACVPDDVEPDTCVSVVAFLRNEFASRFAGVRPLAADSKAVYRPLWLSRGRRPCPHADGVGRATVQWWTEGQVLQLFSTVLLPLHRPPF